MSDSKAEPKVQGRVQKLFGALRRYGLAVGAVAAGFLLRLALTWELGAGLPTYITFFPAVMLAALLGGLGPGLAATVLTALVVDYWLLEPQGFLRHETAIGLAGQVLFLVLGASMSIVAELYRRSRQKAAGLESQRQRVIAEAVEQERKRFNDVLNMLPVYTILLSPDYRVPFANRFFEQRFGKSNGKRCFEYLFNRTEPCEKCDTYTVLKTNAPHRWEWTGPDGRNYDIYDFPFTDADGSNLIMEVGLDITETRRAQESLKEANERLEQRVAERTAELRESEERFRAIFESSSDCILVWDRQYNYLYANQAAIEYVGTTRDKVVGKNMRDALGHVPDFMKLWMGRVEQAFATGKSFRVEDAMPLGDRLVYSESQVSPIRDTAGQVFAVGVVYRDVTARKQTEAALRQNEELLRAVTDNSADAIYVKDRQSRWLLANPALLKLVGKSLEEVLGKTDAEIYANPATGAAILANDGQVIARGEPTAFEERTETAGGARVFLSTKAPRRDAEGRVVGLIGISRDITERKQAEEALRELNAELERRVEERTADLVKAGEKVRAERQRFLDMLDTLPVIIDIIRKDHRIEWANRAYREALGDNQGQLCFASQFGRTEPCEECQAFLPFKTGQPQHWEWTLPNGRTFDIYDFPFTDAEGAPAILEMDIDITERRNAQAELKRLNETLERRVEERTAALRKSEERYRFLFEHMLDGFAYCRMIQENGTPKDFVYLSVNRSFESLTGLKNVLGKPVSEVIPGIHQSNPELLRIYGRVALGGEPERFETYVATLGIWLSIAVYSPEKDHFVAVFDNITERKRAEAEAQRLFAMVQQERDRLESLINSMSDEVWFADTDKKFKLANPSAVREFGAKVAGIEVEKLVASLEVLRPDGSLRTVEETPPLRALRGETVTNQEEIVRTPASKELRYRQVSSAPVRNNNGVIIGSVSVVRDITERRRAEEALRKAKEELARTNELLELKVKERTAKLQELVADLEHFSYTLIHDMRAPLRTTRAFGQMIVEECAGCEKEQPRQFLRRITSAAERMDALITDSLSFTKAVREELPLEPVDVTALLRGILDSYPELQTSKADIQIEGEVPVVMGNQAGLTQCFSNLLGNAVKFVPAGRLPQVRIRGEQIDNWVRIYVEDNGIGIPAEALGRVFDMFHRVHKEYEGTGIGLALVRKVAQRMGGRVGVESKAGSGSRFWIDLRPFTETLLRST